MCCTVVIFMVICKLTDTQQVVRSECQPECSDDFCERCPDGMFLYESTAFRNETKCTYPTTTTETSTESTTNTSTESTTTVPTVQTTQALLSMNAKNVYRICVSSCPVGYRNESYKCFRCNSLCLNCTTAGDTTDVCACKYGDNSNGTCLSKTEDTGGIDERIIIGAGAGGGVLVVVIIIVVVCYCCRRGKLKDQGKTRMSVLLEGRDESGDNTCHVIEPEKAPSKQTTLQRQHYENTGRFDDKKVAKQAQFTQDKIFRYVKDPVTGQEKTNPRESDIYTNSSAIKLNTNFKSGSSEDIEISMLPKAPKPPGSGFSKKKTMSRHKTAKGMTNHALADPTEQENYEDMSGKVKQEIEQSTYTAFDPDEEPTEDYANYQRNPNEEMPQEYYENPPNPNAHIDDDEQEDYENVQNALSKANMDDTEEQEDYENYTFHHDEGPSEDYENLNTDNPYMNMPFGKQ